MPRTWTSRRGHLRPGNLLFGVALLHTGSGVTGSHLDGALKLVRDGLFNSFAGGPGMAGNGWLWFHGFGAFAGCTALLMNSYEDDTDDVLPLSTGVMLTGVGAVGGYLQPASVFPLIACIGVWTLGRTLWPPADDPDDESGDRAGGFKGDGVRLA